MPRPLLGKNLSNTQNQTLSATPAPQSRAQITDKLACDKILRKKRSKEYMDAIAALDAGGSVTNQEKVDAIQKALHREFAELDIDIGGFIIGYAAKCYLGGSYEVHTITMAGTIIEHYKQGQPLPSGMEKARSLAMSGWYAFIEVYPDCMRAVSQDGTVSVVPG